MTDVVTSADRSDGPLAFSRLADLGSLLKRSDLGLAVGVMAILVVLILPLPSLLLDFALAISITFSVLILMTSLFIQAPLEFSAFPTVLLIATMLRLALNLASTRLILARGHEGTDAAGHVIQAFGNFVMAGNFIIGIIVFTILVIVNFVVITKGSGRIAEVAARFHLDSMPGKQMAIDADLSAGLIDEKEARRRRKNLEDESGFFGAMDGASKFVRGDAIAGLLVLLINVIGGMVIGIMQQGLSFAEAGHAYTLLSVGDGLVTQVPALIVSIAAGLLVSKAGVAGAADKALLSQFSGYPKALGMSAAVMLVMALLPGIPMIPFVALGGGTAALAYVIDRRRKRSAAADDAKKAETEKTAPTEEPMSATLKMDDLKIELGLRAVAAGQRERQRRPPHRADQGVAPVARRRNGLRHAVGAHPRQRPARRQQLRHQDQGGRLRQRQGLVRPVHGDGSDRQAGDTAGRAYDRADIRPARHLDRSLAQGGGVGEGVYRRRLGDRARDPSHRADQGQHVRASLYGDRLSDTIHSAGLKIKDKRGLVECY